MMSNNDFAIRTPKVLLFGTSIILRIVVFLKSVTFLVLNVRTTIPDGLWVAPWSTKGVRSRKLLRFCARLPKPASGAGARKVLRTESRGWRGSEGTARPASEPETVRGPGTSTRVAGVPPTGSAANRLER